MTEMLFEEQLIARTPASKKMYERASRVLPGGVAGNGKFLPPYPIYLLGGHGAEVVDIDGNKYVDLLMGGGVHILGHSPASVLRAVHEQIDIGVHYYMAAEAEVKMAEKVCQLMPSCEMVRFVNTGSEATQMALRTARAFSKRNMIAKFEGNFHGQHEYVLVSTLGVSGPAEAPEPHIDSAGVPDGVIKQLLILPYNDANRAEEEITKHASELGAVIVEPVSAFGLGVVPADVEFLKALRAVCTRFEIPLIFDEVVTNFRLGLGGAMEYFGVQPDLVSLGKIIGGGFAIGGYGGKREIMEKVVTPKAGLWDLSNQIFQSGCFSGNPVSMTAGLVVLEELEKGQVHPHINHMTQLLANGLREIGGRLDLPIMVNAATSIIQVHFGSETIHNKRDALKVDRAASLKFHLGLRANGVIASYHPLFLSAAHNEQHIKRVLEIAELVMQQMKEPVSVN
jgi:glutamate-1-semialdehyde 2,1-aminomutase